MCKELSQGGRCAHHTRDEFQKSMEALRTACANGARPHPVILTRMFSAATEHASTPSGQKEVLDAAAKTRGALSQYLTDAAARGQVALDHKAAVRKATANARRVRTPQGWVLEPHVVEQAESKGIDIAQIIKAVEAPATTYANGRFPGQMRHIRDGICVVVDPAGRKAITVYLDRVETDLRADQTDADALKYGRRRQAGSLNAVPVAA